MVYLTLTVQQSPCCCDTFMTDWCLKLVSLRCIFPLCWERGPVQHLVRWRDAGSARFCWVCMHENTSFFFQKKKKNVSEGFLSELVCLEFSAEPLFQKVDFVGESFCTKKQLTRDSPLTCQPSWSGHKWKLNCYVTRFSSNLKREFLC